MTDISPPSAEAVSAFWARAVAAGAVAAGTPVPTAVEAFGDSAELADELLGLVLHGSKRATAGALAEYRREDQPIPVAGDLWVATDGSGRPRAVLRTTEVRVGPLPSVDDAFAWDEGEGDRTRASWLRDHERYFRRALPAVGLTFAPDLPTVFERFEVPYAE
jgi:uncharacterized protein YhfF